MTSRLVLKTKGGSEELTCEQYTFASIGPGVTWDYISRISAAIPTLRKLKDHCQYEWNNYTRYKKHTAPDYEEDLKALCASYDASGIHRKTEGRKLHSKDTFADAHGKGEIAMIQGKVIARWHERREREVSEKEVWLEGDDSNDEFLFDGDN